MREWIGKGPPEFAALLSRAGFDFAGADQFGIGHRFRRGNVSIDLLGPHGFSKSLSRLTTIPPARTVGVPGGTQALRRTELVKVDAGGRVGSIPRPNLLGAILLKARAVEVDDVPEAQLADLTFLLSIASNPVDMANDLEASERKWLRRRQELHVREGPAWRSLEPDDREDAHDAYIILADM